MDATTKQFADRHRPRKTPEQKDRERLARIETRVTTIALAMGIDVPCAKPEFITAGLVPGTNRLGPTITLPSINSVLREVLGAIPDGWSGPIDLILKGELIGTIALSRVDAETPVP